MAVQVLRSSLGLVASPCDPQTHTAKSGCPTSLVEILRIMLCSSCAMIARVEEKFGRVMISGPVHGDLSSRSSFGIFEDAQAKRISATRCGCFPHFHSDGYYSGLYTSYKTGYSSPSQ